MVCPFRPEINRLNHVQYAGTDKESTRWRLNFQNSIDYGNELELIRYYGSFSFKRTISFWPTPSTFQDLIFDRPLWSWIKKLLMQSFKIQLNSCVAFWQISAKRLFPLISSCITTVSKTYPQGLPLLNFKAQLLSQKQFLEKNISMAIFPEWGWISQNFFVQSPFFKFIDHSHQF